jgi:hypothetical protein
MRALIVRELQDHVVYVVLLSLVVAMAVVAAILTGIWGITEVSPVIVGATMPMLLVLFCTLGVSQMYTDRAHRISALLATSAATRSRIMAARVLAGVAIMLPALVALLITALSVLYFDRTPLHLYRGMIVEISVTAALASFAGYCVGLLAGWTLNRTMTTLSIFFGTVLVMLLVIVKGFWMPAAAILLLFSVAALIRVWCRFTSIAL